MRGSSVTTAGSAGAATGKRGSVFTRLYTGTGAFDIVGRRKVWYLMFGTAMLICILSIIFRGFNYGIDFTGGTSIQFPATGAKGVADTAQVEQVVTDSIGHPPESVQQVGAGSAQAILVKTDTLSATDTVKLNQALYTAFEPLGPDGKPSPEAISVSAVSASWGGEISSKAAIALGVFLVLVTIFLAFYFERAMAAAALVALVNDVTITAGVYSLVGFEVTPATVIGLLTILGFSLYDTVVVFDKVRENTRGLLGLTRRTYAETANLATNQTLMRSINTSLIAVLPVLGLLVVGVGLLGVGTLGDLALVQMVGILVGTGSSIFLATPILVDLKMRDPRYQQQEKRVLARRAKLAAARGRAPVDAGQADAAPYDDGTDPVDVTDDAALAGELRRERAVAAAAGVPARAATPRRNTPRTAQRPSGKPSRPTGKKRR